MKWLDKIKERINDFLIDHRAAKLSWTYFYKTVVTVISSFLFAYGFRAFINPGIAYDRIISGGASGLSQTIFNFISIFGNFTDYENLILSILYFVINIPLFILALVKISKQFAFFTLLNVALVSIFNAFIPDSWFFNLDSNGERVYIINILDDLLARCIFGGITTGLSSGLSMIIGSSSGGFDIVSIFISEKKSTSPGRYTLIINSTNMFFFVLFSSIGNYINPSWNIHTASELITMALYSMVYLFISSHVVDFLNTKNLKVELQIFTSNEQVPIILTRAFTHTCTVSEGIGAYSGKKQFIIYMVVSRSERKKAVRIVRSVDKYSFITVTDLNQVYGKFFIKPFE